MPLSDFKTLLGWGVLGGKVKGGLGRNHAWGEGWGGFKTPNFFNILNPPN